MASYIGTAYLKFIFVLLSEILFVWVAESKYCALVSLKEEDRNVYFNTPNWRKGMFEKSVLETSLQSWRGSSAMLCIYVTKSSWLQRDLSSQRCCWWFRSSGMFIQVPVIGVCWCSEGFTAFIFRVKQRTPLLMLFDPEDEGIIMLRNSCLYLTMNITEYCSFPLSVISCKWFILSSPTRRSSRFI
jgi:hypothetical protein